MGFVVMMERGCQWPDLETLLPWRPLEGIEGSYRQSADGLWVNPFKHELPLSFFFLFFFFKSLFISLSAKSPHQPVELLHFIFSTDQQALNKISAANKQQKVPVSTYMKMMAVLFSEPISWSQVLGTRPPRRVPSTLMYSA